MRCFLLLIYASLASRLLASWDDCFPESDTIYKNVHVISGQLTLHCHDLTVHGAKPLALVRSYSSSGFDSEQNKDEFFLKIRSGWTVQGGWSFFPHTDMFIQLNGGWQNPLTVILKEPSGAIIRYTTERKISSHQFLLKPEENTPAPLPGMDELSARTDPRNNRLEVNLKMLGAVLTLPNGGKRYYTGHRAPKDKDGTSKPVFFFLKSEQAPSGERTIYEYHNEKTHQLKRIYTTDPSMNHRYAEIEFEEPASDTKNFHVKAAGNREIEYRFLEKEGHNYLTHAISNFSLPETFSPSPSRKNKGFRVDEIWMGDSLQLNVKYYTPASIEEERAFDKHPGRKPFCLDRVESIEGPIGPIAHFQYEKGRTELRNSLGRRTVYEYNPKNGQLQTIQFFDDQDTLYSSERFYWKNSRLFCKALVDEKLGAVLLARTFVYDAIGNVIEEALWGNLTGTTCTSIELDSEGNPRTGEVYKKRYAYLPEFNVPIRQEEDNGLVRLFQYKPNTDLLEARYTSDGKQILSREFFTYNEAHLLVEEIVDDGASMDRNDLQSVTHRLCKKYILDPDCFLPLEIRESYWENQEEHLLFLKRFKYSNTGQVIHEEVFDANEHLRYAIETDYDAAGRIIRKTDPLGEESLYTFDAHGRLSSVQEAGSPLCKKIHYDEASRISYTEEFDPQKNQRSSGIYYNSEGHVTKTVDAFGNAITFRLDPFGRAEETYFPESLDDRGLTYTPTIKSTYNPQGDLIAVSDAKGHSTVTSYNAYRKPVQIDSPDGGTLRHQYDLSGTVAKTIHPDGSEERYEYNVLQKQTSKKIYSALGELLSEETWDYKGNTLLAYTNPNGLTTKYSYDGTRRKITEEADGQTIRFKYDSLGFLSETLDEATSLKHCFLRDVVGKIEKEWDEEPNGKQECCLRYEYDRYQRKKIIARTIDHQTEAIDWIWYDTQGRIVKHTDPLNQTTHIEYREDFQNALYQSVLQKTTTDPLGHLTVETFDALGHLVCTEKKDPLACLVARDEFFYDQIGNKVKSVTTVLLQNKVVRQTTSTYVYDAKKRLIQSIEAGVRSHCFTFDAKGRLTLRQKPDGVKIFYSYDGIDRLIELKSSDRSIHFEFNYEKGKKPTKIFDRIQQTSMDLTYDLRGNLLFDHLRFEYDRAGRCIKILLPNNSSIDYSYSGSHLKQVARRGAEPILCTANSSQEPSREPYREVFYTHTYAEFNANGQVEEEQMILGLGSLATKHDLLGRPIEQISTQLHTKAHYDEIGRFDWVYDSFHGENKYHYDGLSQLTEEKNKSYSFDSIGNPAKEGYVVNELNELLHTPFCHFEYDLNGNPLKRTEENGTVTTYQFDAMDRLVKITKPDRIVRYRYDGLSRLSYKETFILENGLWQNEKKLRFLYDGQTEIGIEEEDGSIVELKILGLGIQGDVGSTIAIELNGIAYAPLHDFRGNIIAIVSSANEVVEQYDLSAFGEETESKHLNPWRFSSKRSDEGLISFGKRFYDPSLQRWLSTDPAGFIDGPNLYSYVLNNPTNRLDELGLYSTWVNGDVFGWNAPSSIRSPYVATLAPCPDIYLGQSISIDCTAVGIGEMVFQFAPEIMPSTNPHLQTIFSHTDWTAALKGNDQSPIVTFSILVNGINVPKDELFGSAEIMHKGLAGTSPVLGMHNASNGVLSALNRIMVEMYRVDTVSVVGLRQLLSESMDYFANVCPNFRIFLAGHSEGGLIIHNAIQGMDDTHRAMALKHLIIRTYGTVQFVPDNFGADVNNTCSIKDYAAAQARRGYAKQGSMPEGSTVTFVPCISSWSERTWYGGPDHNFRGPTYQKALHDDINRLGEKYEFIYSKTR